MGDCCQHEAPENRQRQIYFARDYYVCCLLACLNFPDAGIDSLYMDMYYFGQAYYFRIII